MTGTNGNQRRISVGIVGAGFGGIGTAIQLRKEGLADFTIFERGDSVGGVWRANTYPGACCDVPSHLYSFSFAQGTDWSKRYAPQDEILDYLNKITDDHDLRPNLKLSTEVTKASFDADSALWNLTTGDGEEYEFNVLVTACGQLTNPIIPELPGLEDFEGESFHSAHWNHDHDLTGRNVAVIGTGASAIQFVPAIAEEVAELTIYQRSAPWVIPKPDRRYPEWERRLFKAFPPRVAVARAANFGFFEVSTYGFTGKDWMMRPFTAAANAYRKRALPDAEIRAKATPDYEIGCKRVLFTSDWYPTLMRDNVELISGGVERVTATGVVGPDGVERPADTIIWGTGFASHDFVAPMEINGLDGAELNEVWADRPEAFLGTTVSGFPNMYVLYGPNTNHGSGSVPYTHECQISYILDGVRRLRDGGLRYLDLRPEVQAEWRREIEERSQKTTWVTGGGTNWYVTEAGVNTNNWPGPWLEYRRRTKRLAPEHYRSVA